MNYSSLIKNIANALNTTPTIGSALKKLWWMYDLNNKLGLKRDQMVVKLRYPKPLNTFKLVVRSNNGSDYFIVSEVFEHECYRIDNEESINYIIDLGSNAGFSAVYFAKHFPEAELALVEPMPNNIELLKANLAINNVKASIFEGAISIDAKDIRMTISDNDYGHKVDNIQFGKHVGSSTISVASYTMQGILDTLKWPRVDLLKIDIEGFEGVLLATNNEWLGRVKMIIMEIHEGVCIETISETMKSHSFSNRIERNGNWIFSKNQ